MLKRQNSYPWSLGDSAIYYYSNYTFLAIYEQSEYYDKIKSKIKEVRHLRVRFIMDCLFKICSPKDPVNTAIVQMAQENTSYLIAVDENNRYCGILPAAHLLIFPDKTAPVAPLIIYIPPVKDSDPITILKKVDSDVVPVVNDLHSIVGVINLKSLIEYLPETLAATTATIVTDKNRNLASKYTIDDIIGQSRDILTLKEKIIAAAKTKATVLVVGETGTGKELVAHAIHRLSERRHQPFVRMNCATIPENLLESELFGYEPGAFTGAVKTGYAGKFEVANKGTIFLDEIGDMPLALQAKILRVLQEKEIEKIGSRAPQPVDVRIIAATHRNLLELIDLDKFRQDLYYRLHVIPIQVPPLRGHREDIPVLLAFLLAKFSAELGQPQPKVDHSFLQALLDYDWPGNIRELANVVEAAVSMSGGILSRQHLLDLAAMPKRSGARDDDETVSLRSFADDAEKEAILSAIKQYNGNKIKISEALGISRSSLYNKLKKYNIDLN